MKSLNFPNCTVLITTYNRPHFLNLSLNSLISNNDVSNHEIIVVDSNSTDHKKNKEIVNRINIDHNLKIKYIRNCNDGGLTSSRNLGVSAATNEIIVQVDDDSLPGLSYIESAIMNLAFEPKVDVVVGKILPKYDCDADNELIKRITTTLSGYEGYLITDLSCMDLGCVRRSIPHELAFSTNCAYRRQFYIDGGGIGPDGFSGSKILLNGSGEHHYTRNAKEIIYEPAMVSEHIITKDRISYKYLMSRSFFYGIGVSFDYWSGKHNSIFELLKIVSLNLLRSALKLDAFEILRSLWFLKGACLHTINCLLSSKLRAYCRRTNWFNFDFSGFKFYFIKNSVSQWEIIKSKELSKYEK